jgi:hypothetical protein
MKLHFDARRALTALALTVAAGWLMGLGGGNGAGTEKAIPIPQKNFTVAVADARGLKAQVERFTWEGKVHIQGQYGNATITLPFQKVLSIKVGAGPAPAPTLVMSRVTLRSGETLELAVARSSKCYGESTFGNYEIFFKDIAELQFQ